MTSPEAELDRGGDHGDRGAELRTFLIADIRGYTTYTAEVGDAAAARLVRRFSALVREVVEAREGKLLELRGDEALVVFVSARQALRAATELQRRLGDEDLPRGVGIGLDAGEAVPVDDGYRGTSLNVAARLCGRAGPGEILASETVVRLASKVEGIDYVDLRTLRLKGLDQPVRVFAVARSDQPARRRRPRPSLAGLDRRLVAAAGAAGLVAMVGAVALLTGMAGGPGTSQRPSSGQPPSPTPGPPTAPGAADIDSSDLPVLAWIDSATHGIVGILEEPAAGADATYVDGAFWVLDPGDRARPRAIHRLDGEGRVQQAIPIAFDIQSWTIGDGRLYVAELESIVHVFDIASGREIDQIVVGGFTTSGAEVSGLEYREPIWDISFGQGSLWVAGGWAGDVIRVDPSTGATTKRVSTFAPGFVGVADGVASEGDTTWVLDSWTGRVMALDAASNRIESRAVLSSGVGPIMAGGGAAWVADGEAGTVIRVDRLGLTKTYSVGSGVAATAFDEASETVWATSYDGGTLTSIDVLTGETRTVSLGHAVTSVAVHDGRVLVGLARSPAEVVAALEGTVLRIGTDESFAETDPAYGERSESRRQFDDATCAGLLERRSEVAADGSVLEPLVAAAMPDVSEDGRTYTFRVRQDFAFSPPSNEPLTAETYRQSIERAVRMTGTELFDVEGLFDFLEGGAERISGITAEGDRLTIRLTAPSSTFLERLSLPHFCPVPVSTPVVPTGLHQPPIPRSGPYYIAEHVPGQVMVLGRNPNYPGPRTEGFDWVTWFTEPNLGRAVGRWERGDLDIVVGDGPELAADSRTDRRWGPRSEAAAAGDQRLHHRARRELAFLAVNPASQVLGDPAVRRAVALALDRPALAAYWGIPTDEVVPSSMPGFAGADRFPLDGPRQDEARALLGDRRIELQVAWPRETFCPECPALGEAFRQQLAAVGIDVTLKAADDPFLFANGLDSGYDLAWSYVRLEFPDLAEWMIRLLSAPAAPDRPAYGETAFPWEWVPQDLATERDRLKRLTGRERFDAAIALADRVRDGLSVITFVEFVHSQLVSDRVGCLSFPPGTVELDLVAACPA